MFAWIWVVVWSALVLPLAAASLRGWAPERARARTSRRAVRARGLALLLIWVSGLVGPVIWRSSWQADEVLISATAVQGALLLLAGGLVAGSQVATHLRRSHPEQARQDTPDRTDAHRASGPYA